VAKVKKIQEHDSFALVQRALADIRRGKMVILTDDEDRENEGPA
jgi:3,4-dihydroxy 2-butanone 4-phosphate synthase/GTP cyclohydrolase II